MTRTAMFAIHSAATLAAALAVALAIPSSATAASIKPGLWEMTSKVPSADPAAMQAMAQAQQQMASLPPEQRRAIEQALAKQGVTLSLAEGGGVKVKFCITPEQAANPTMPHGQPGDCSSTRTKIPGGLAVQFTCKNPASKGNGQVIFDGDTGFSMRMAVDSTVAGKAQHMTSEGTGRWLASECGTVQPVR
jgi:Protein of unknown function (DUF3617)